MLTKESIIQMLKTDKRAVARALVVLHNRQTNDEQAQEGTRHLNGRGFRPCHARMGSSMAKQFNSLGFLSEKQIAYWRMLDRQGNMRIGIYAGQLLEEAQLKAALKIDGYKLHNYGPRGTASAGLGVVIAQNHLNGYAVPATEHTIISGKIARDTAKYGERDFGNDMERKMVLEEQLGDVMDSDDPALIDPISNEIKELDDYWFKLRGNK